MMLHPSCCCGDRGEATEEVVATEGYDLQKQQRSEVASSSIIPDDPFNSESLLIAIKVGGTELSPSPVSEEPAPENLTSLEQDSPLPAGSDSAAPVDRGPCNSYSFRFFNYNMANQPELSLEDSCSGFSTLRSRSVPLSSGPSADEKADLRGSLASLGSTSVGQFGELPWRSSEGPRTSQQPASGDQPTSRSSASWDQPAYSVVGELPSRSSAAAMYGARSSAASTTGSRSSAALVNGATSFSNGNTASVSLFKLMTQGLEDSIDQDVALSWSNMQMITSDCETFVGKGDSSPSIATSGHSSMRSTASSAQSADDGTSSRADFSKSRSIGNLIRKGAKKITLKKPKRPLFPAGHMRGLTATTVDCVLGTLSETRFPLEDYTKGMSLQDGAHFHSTSALQCLNAIGAGAAMKGKVAQQVSGDLKSFALCRSTLKEVTDGSVFCSFEASSQGMTKGNPMKSFIGQTFETVDSEMRFIFLGTHFPMAKVSSLLQDTTKPPAEVLTEMKCLVARLMQKVLDHLHDKRLINVSTMVILQGDLNSRCVFLDGEYVDLLAETLLDPRLQEFTCDHLPSELQGEWREVVEYADAAELPATYRFAKDKVLAAAQTQRLSQSLSLRDIYGKGDSDTPSSYRQVLERLKATGTMEDWGLYDPHRKDDKAKFKPSRLPACADRVIYYAPTAMLDRCSWEAPRGYEVNYLHAGSDHRPVLLEATLSVAQDQSARVSKGCRPSQAKRHSVIVKDVDFEEIFKESDEQPLAEESDDSNESVVGGSNSMRQSVEDGIRMGARRLSFRATSA